MSTNTDNTAGLTAADLDGKAVARFIRITPMKARRVIDLVRGKNVEQARSILRFAPQAASDAVLKLVDSAVANARHTADQASVAFDERELVIKKAFVDEGPTMKRFRPRAQGRASRILKRTSHITVVVGAPETNAKGGVR